MNLNQKKKKNTTKTIHTSTIRRRKFALCYVLNCGGHRREPVRQFLVPFQPNKRRYIQIIMVKYGVYAIFFLFLAVCAANSPPFVVLPFITIPAIHPFCITFNKVQAYTDYMQIGRGDVDTYLYRVYFTLLSRLIFLNIRSEAAMRY